MWGAIAGPLLNIVHEGIKMWAEERRTRFMDEYHDILEELEEAKNEDSEDYTDIDLHNANKRLCIFLEAYASELRRNNMEILQGKG